MDYAKLWKELKQEVTRSSDIYDPEKIMLSVKEFGDIMNKREKEENERTAYCVRCAYFKTKNVGKMISLICTKGEEDKKIGCVETMNKVPCPNWCPGFTEQRVTLKNIDPL